MAKHDEPAIGKAITEILGDDPNTSKRAMLRKFNISDGVLERIIEAHGLKFKKLTNADRRRLW